MSVCVHAYMYYYLFASTWKSSTGLTDCALHWPDQTSNQLIHWTNTSTHTIKLTLNYPTTTCANTDKHSTLSLSQSPHSLNTHTPSHSFTHTKVMYKYTHIHTQWNSPTNKITCLQHTHTPIHNHPHTLIHTLTNPQPLTHIFTLHCSSINAVVDNWILRQFTYELVQYRV